MGKEIKTSDMKDSQVTIGEYKNIVLPEVCEDEARDRFVVNNIMKTCDAQVPEDEIRERGAAMFEQYDIRLSQQGLSIDEYCHIKNMNKEELMSQFMKHAERQIKERKVLIQIADLEGISASEDDFRNYLDNLGKKYPLPPEKAGEILTSRKKDIMEEITLRKTIDHIIMRYCRTD